jgi:regulation of enolase protein 1 (concanavalin A-like superfamily)
MGDEFALDGLPLRWQVPPVSWSHTGGTGLIAVAGPRTDLFVDPGGSTQTLNAPRLLGMPTGDFTLTARVAVDFAADFDAGVLLLHADDRTWAKLCFEYSPQGEPMVVSVVTRGVSDDANAFVVDGREVWLRIARIGAAYVFHASTDGKFWQFVRHFALPGEPAVGFVVQSPTGEGCTATFADVHFAAERLADLRGGA